MVTFLLFCVLLFVFGRADAQKSPKIPRVGLLAAGSASSLASRIRAFREQLEELGYVEGKNILVEYRFADGKSERLADDAAHFVRSNIDLIIAEGASAAHAAKNATKTIPIVIGHAADPVGTGLVTNLARPGGNVTGLSDFTLGVITKRLEILIDAVPNASRIGVVLNPKNPTNPLQLKDLQELAPLLRITLVSFEVKKPDDFKSALTMMNKARVAASIVMGDPMFSAYRTQLLHNITNSRMPAIWAMREYVLAGGLMSYGADFDDLFRRAAIYVEKILKGAKPAELPVEQPTKFEFVVNLKAAKQIGLTIPPHVLARADRVIR